ncbi:MAG: twin-arginine translocation signal domain-containing protein, partial [Alphaproteobacteria bacterium]|nr:twin-arginine translocation signal domain-containing protein [Alphaproteobacteria bacterium]
MNQSNLEDPQEDVQKNPTRRDFLVLTSSALGVLGAGALLWPFVDSM